MNGSDGPEESSKTPPTMSPVTVANFVETHRRTLPSRIDKSMMQNLAGGDRPKLLNALRFLGLVEGPNDVPSPRFTAFRDAADDTAVSEIWAATVMSAFHVAVDGLDMASATQLQIDERFKQAYNISGDTVRKAVAFFLSLARLGNIPLSTYVKKTRPRGTGNAAGPKRTPKAAKAAHVSGGGSGSSGTIPNGKPSGSSAMIVRFVSGGSATLYVDADWVQISTEDRQALLGWIDSMKDYAAKNPVPETKVPEAATSGT